MCNTTVMYNHTNTAATDGKKVTLEGGPTRSDAAEKDRESLGVRNNWWTDAIQDPEKCREIVATARQNLLYRIKVEARQQEKDNLVHHNISIIHIAIFLPVANPRRVICALVQSYVAVFYRRYHLVSIS